MYLADISLGFQFDLRRIYKCDTLLKLLLATIRITRSQANTYMYLADISLDFQFELRRINKCVRLQNFCLCDWLLQKQKTKQTEKTKLTLSLSKWILDSSSCFLPWQRPEIYKILLFKLNVMIHKILSTKFLKEGRSKNCFAADCF